LDIKNSREAAELSSSQSGGSCGGKGGTPSLRTVVILGSARREAAAGAAGAMRVSPAPARGRSLRGGGAAPVAARCGLHKDKDVVLFRLERPYLDRRIALLEDDHHDVVANVPLPFELPCARPRCSWRAAVSNGPRRPRLQRVRGRRHAPGAPSPGSAAAMCSRGT